jgi:hypothetical protein
MATGKLARIQPDFFRHALCSDQHQPNSEDDE